MSSNVWKIEAESLPIIERVFAEGSESMQGLKRETLGNRYKYLTFKAIEGPPERKRGLVAIRFLWEATKNDPSMLLRLKIMSIVLFKIAIAVLLPAWLGGQLLAIAKQFQR